MTLRRSMASEVVHPSKPSIVQAIRQMSNNAGTKRMLTYRPFVAICRASIHSKVVPLAVPSRVQASDMGDDGHGSLR